MLFEAPTHVAHPMLFLSSNPLTIGYRQRREFSFLPAAFSFSKELSIAGSLGLFPFALPVAVGIVVSFSLPFLYFG